MNFLNRNKVAGLVAITRVTLVNKNPVIFSDRFFDITLIRTRKFVSGCPTHLRNRLTDFDETGNTYTYFLSG